MLDMFYRTIRQGTPARTILSAAMCIQSSPFLFPFFFSSYSITLTLMSIYLSFCLSSLFARSFSSTSFLNPLYSLIYFSLSLLIPSICFISFLFVTSFFHPFVTMSTFACVSIFSLFISFLFLLHSLFNFVLRFYFSIYNSFLYFFSFSLYFSLLVFNFCYSSF